LPLKQPQGRGSDHPACSRKFHDSLLYGAGQIVLECMGKFRSLCPMELAERHQQVNENESWHVTRSEEVGSQKSE
jgi:hypothetical protein